VRAYSRRVGAVFGSRIIAGFAISALILLPCLWHRRIEAGDLASHAYNTWLAQLIARGQAPGLYIEKQWNNILFDLMLLRAGESCGLAAAQKIVVSICVLVFFWGAFAFISSGHRTAAVVAYAMHRHAGLRLFLQHGIHELLFIAGASVLWFGDSLARERNRLDRRRGSLLH